MARIPRSFFQNCSSLETADIPAAVRYIEDRAFYGCKSLKTVNLLDGLTLLEDYAFSECDTIPSVTIPGSLYNVGAYAFYSCDELAEVLVKPGVREIGRSELHPEMTLQNGCVFWGCKDNMRITLLPTVLKVYRNAFDEKKTITTTDENGQQTQTVLAVQKYMDATEDYLNRIEFDKPEDKEGFNYRLTVDSRSDYGGPLAPIHPYTYSSIRLPDLTEPGYTLKGWTLFGSYFRPGDTWRLQNLSFTCMADWTPIQNTVTFASDQGEAPPDQTVISGSKATAPAAQVVGEEYIVGWYKTPDFTGEPYDFSATVLDSFTLYAKWASAPLVDVEISGDEAAGNAVIFRDKDNSDLIYATFTASGSAYVPAGAEMVITAADDMDYSGAVVTEVPLTADGMIEVRTHDIVNDTSAYAFNYGNHATVNIEFTAAPRVIVGTLLIDDAENLSQGVIDGLWILQNNATPAQVLTEGYLIPVSDDMVGDADDIMHLTLYPPEGYTCDGSIINGNTVTTVCAGKTEYGGLVPKGNLTLNLHFYKTENYVTLTFNSVNNSSYFTLKYPKGQDAAATFEMPECPFSYSVYAFNHWQMGDDAESVLHPGDTVDLPDTDTAYNAVWDKAYALKFRANVQSYETFSGSMETIPAYEKDDYTATVPECGFSRPGFAFVGWNTRANGRGDSYQPGDPITLTASLTLYAQWKEAFTVKLYPNFEGGGDPVRQKIPQGYGAALLSPFTREDCLLTGWNNVSDGSGSVSYAVGETIYPTDDMTLYAQWHEHDYQFDSFLWAEDETSAQVKLVCAADEAVKYVDAEMQVTPFEATCEADAYTVYEAVYGGHGESNTQTEEDSALGHAYGSPEWTWTVEYAETQEGESEKVVSAVMAMPCSRCGKIYTWNAEAESEATTEPTQTQPGVTTCTAAVTVDGAEYTDEMTEAIPALGLPADEATEALIDAIGEVEYTEECRAAIEMARAVYDSLTAAPPIITEWSPYTRTLTLRW